MNHSAKIGARGQITLPADIRKSLGLAAGDSVEFVPTAAGNFEIRAPAETLANLLGVFKADEPVSGEDIERWIGEARAAMGTKGANGRN